MWSAMLICIPSVTQCHTMAAILTLNALSNFAKMVRVLRWRLNNIRWTKNYSIGVASMVLFQNLWSTAHDKRISVTRAKVADNISPCRFEPWWHTTQWVSLCDQELRWCSRVHGLSVGHDQSAEISSSVSTTETSGFQLHCLCQVL